MVATIANIVSVALSGLFITLPVVQQIPKHFKLQADPGLGSAELILDYINPVARNITDNAALPPWITPSQYILPLTWSSAATSSPQQEALRARVIGIGLEPRCEVGHGVSFDLGNLTGEVPDILVTATKLVNGMNITCSASLQQFPGLYGAGEWDDGFKNVIAAAQSQAISQESATQLVPFSPNNSPFRSDESCDNFYAISWLRAGVGDGKPSQRGAPLPNVAAKVVLCDPIIQASEFDVLVDAAGLVLDIDKSTATPRDDVQLFFLSVDTTKPDSPSVVNPIEGVFNSFLPGSGTAAGYWHNATVAVDWLNYLIMLKTQSYDHVNPQLPPPDPEEMLPIISDILKRQFALTLGVARTWLATPVPLSNDTLDGFIEYTEDRIFFAPYMFELTTSLLAFNLVVALIVLLRRPGRLLPRMPTTIAAITCYLSGSSILEDLMDEKATPESLAKGSAEFSFGKYIGTDGLPHLGIDRDQYVRLVEPKRSLRWLRKRWK